MATSYNGWPASPDPNAINIVKFGDKYGFPFPGGAKGGDVHTVLGYVASQLHKRVEPCVSGWCWGYNYRANVNNPSTLSCHSSGTAIDWNAPDHPNGASKTFTSSQVGVIRQILAEVQGAVQWGGDYTGTKDEMHFEIIVNAVDLAEVAASLAGTTPPGPTPGPEPEPKIPTLTEVGMFITFGPGGARLCGPGYTRNLDDEEYQALTKVPGMQVLSVGQREWDVIGAACLYGTNSVWGQQIESKVYPGTTIQAQEMLAYTNLHTEPEQ